MFAFNAIEEIRIVPISLLKAGVYSCAIVLVYYSALRQLVLHDWSWEDYSHCALIPFIVLYLIWEKLAALAAIPSSPSWKGLAPFLFGIFLFWLGELGGEYFTLYLSLWFVLVGLVWLHIGWHKLKVIAFAFIMMLAMFPFPNFVNFRVNFYLKLISSQLGVWMLQVFGMSAYREGNIIDLGFTQLQVVDACSGLRYVMPLMVLSLLLAYWFRANLLKRAVLFLSALPLAIFVNSFRIAMTGILYGMFGAEVAEGFFHGFSGWLIFMFAIPFLFLEILLLKKIPPRRWDSVEAGGGGGDRRAWIPASAGMTKKAVMTERVGLTNMAGMTQFLVSIGILLLTLGISHGVEFRQKIPINKSFGQFPMQVGEWTGTREAMEQEFLDFLKFSDYIIANYKNREGKTINFYVAYYQDQRKGESIHSPETCLPGSGWEFKEAGDLTVTFANGKSSMPVSRAFMEKAGEKELVYYWFPQRGRILTKLYWLKIYTFWDSLTKQRTDGALVRLFTPLYPSESTADVEVRLQSFTRQIVPLLDGYLPGK